MRQTVSALALVWWFVMTGSYGEGRVVGPFDTKADCELVRAALGNKAHAPCWETKR